MKYLNRLEGDPEMVRDHVELIQEAPPSYDGSLLDVIGTPPLNPTEPMAFIGRFED